jgi:hypothetical protein
LFDRASFVDARARLIATYGTLLRTGPKYLPYAAKQLPTTKQNVGSFKSFLLQLDSEWSKIDLDNRIGLDPPASAHEAERKD